MKLKGTLLIFSPFNFPLPSVRLSSFPVPLQLPEDFEVVYSQVQGEIVVGGVFLRLFIALPTWVSVFLMM